MKDLKAISLFSGGLDSSLATKLIADQGIEILALHFDNGFQAGKDGVEVAREAAKELGIQLRNESLIDDRAYLQVLKDPDQGYGSNCNPCTDCRIYMLKKGKEIMEESGARFLVTGEVLGQRPKSQRDKGILRMIEKRSGLRGLILRPLSAKLLPETIPEKRGWVDRERLLDLQGRSRGEQFQLAEEYGLSTFSPPSGGCLLTEESFCRRLEEAFQNDGRGEMKSEDFQLLRYGRHFRLPDGSKAIVGRDEEENEALEDFDSLRWRMEVKDFPSPITLIEKEATEEGILLAARLTARYSQGRDEDRVTVELEKDCEKRSLEVEPLAKDQPLIKELRI